ncbi:Protein of unknown function [Streptococcus thermophilus]|nr:Protein of unknown function [Streptococcus thermophilus]
MMSQSMFNAINCCCRTTRFWRCSAC